MNPFYNNQWFSIGLRFAWIFYPCPFSWLSILYSTAIFLIACLDFYMSLILLDEHSVILAFVFVTLVIMTLVFNNQWFSIGLNFEWIFYPRPFSWLSILYSTAFCIFLIACLDFSVSRILLDEQSIINAFVCQRISVSILFCSLGPRATNNQLFLHVVDTALHLLSGSSWPLFKC